MDVYFIRWHCNNRLIVSSRYPLYSSPVYFSMHCNSMIVDIIVHSNVLWNIYQFWITTDCQQWNAATNLLFVWFLFCLMYILRLGMAVQNWSHMYNEIQYMHPLYEHLSVKYIWIDTVKILQHWQRYYLLAFLQIAGNIASPTSDDLL